MIRSTSMMRDIPEVCCALRKKFFGEAASPKDYKDSYIVNEAIDSFKGSPEDLMTPSISQKDQNEIKVSKSINFRSNSHEKLSAIATTLQISESEVCRRIIYYSLEEHQERKAMIETSILKEKVIHLKRQLEESMKALNEVMLAITLLEDEEK